MIKQLAARRKRNSFWHKPKRSKGLRYYVDRNQDNIFAADERVSQFDYKLDNLGQKTDALEQFWTEYNVGVDPLVNHILWTYDSLGRLTSEVFDHYDNAFDQTQEWEYDLVGNRLVQKLDKGNDGIYEAITSYTYDANDRLISELFDDLTEADKDKETLYGYTHTQQTSKTVSEKTNGEFVKQSETTFEYDLQGRMSVVTITTGNRVEVTKYEYGADGIRTSAEHEVWEDEILVSKTRTEYLNDSQNITGYSQVLKQTEFDSEGNVIKEISYVIGHQRISQTVKSEMENVTHLFTFDGHGSTRVLTDYAGAVLQLYSFDAYGSALGFNPSEALTEFLYSGEQFDSKIGQQYLRARYYDPATGRFNRIDPFFGNISDPQSLHKYIYTHNNPVNGIDPSGLFEGLAGMLSSMNSRSGMISSINTSIRVVNFVYKTIDRIQKIQSLFDMSSKLIKLAYRIASVSNPYELPAVLLAEIANEMISKYANTLSGLQVTLGQIKQHIGNKWDEIVEAMRNKAGFMAMEASTEFAKHLPSYIAKVGKGLRFVIYLPSGPTDNKGRGNDTFIPIGDDYELAVATTGGRLFGFGVKVKDDGRNSSAMREQILRVDWWVGLTHNPFLDNNPPGKSYFGTLIHYHVYSNSVHSNHSVIWPEIEY